MFGFAKKRSFTGGCFGFQAEIIYVEMQYFLQMCIAWKQCCYVLFFETAKRRTGPKINTLHHCSNIKGQSPELINCNRLIIQ